MAKYLHTQFGGSNSELAAALRYFSQKFSMPDEKGKSLLNDIATEELGHVEMIATMIKQLTEGASVEEMKSAGLGDMYSEHGMGVYPSNASGVPFTTGYFAVTGDPIADISEDMAAEQKARSTYDNILRVVKDPEVCDPIRFLRKREIIHFQRFGEALRNVQEHLDSRNFYAFNPAFDKSQNMPVNS